MFLGDIKMKELARFGFSENIRPKTMCSFVFYFLHAQKNRAGRQDFLKLLLSLFFSIQRVYGTLQGYLRNETIISQNVPSEVQVIFFYFVKELWSVFKIFTFFHF